MSLFYWVRPIEAINPLNYFKYLEGLVLGVIMIAKGNFRMGNWFLLPGWGEGAISFSTQGIAFS
jgi:hypothetical protein